MAKTGLTFPQDVLLGTATAGYQVEGNSRNTDFWEWEQTPGHIAQAQQSGRACDWWEGGRWQEDFDRAAADGHTAHRMSVEWSRIESKPGQWNEDALDYYRQIVKGLRERGLEPMVTLFHFVNPRWMAESQAWEIGESVSLFERYTRKVVKVLRDDVTLWCTINEPNVYMYAGWVAGFFPPGKKNLRLAFKVAQHLLRAHAASYRAIHELQPTAMVGLPIHFRPIEPASQGFLDRWVAQTQFNLFSSLFPDALRTGKMRQLMGLPVAIPEAKGTQDFVSLNYYTAEVACFDLFNPRELFGRRSFPPGAEVDDANVYASYPPGLSWSLEWFKNLGLPIYITENGIGDEADKMRPHYLITHLYELGRALTNNDDIHGYFHWSLVDNFEWERAWTHRFGLYAMDPTTLIRTPRRSAQLYADICKCRALSTDIVAQYAPELLRTLFPNAT